MTRLGSRGRSALEDELVGTMWNGGCHQNAKMKGRDLEAEEATSIGNTSGHDASGIIRVWH